MTWFVVALIVVVVVLTTAAVLGRVDGSLGDPTRSLSHDPLPETPLTPEDFEELRFDTGLRGYRMGQVDRVVDRLRREITELDEEVARLRRGEEADPAEPAHQPDGREAADPAPADLAPADPAPAGDPSGNPAERAFERASDTVGATADEGR